MKKVVYLLFAAIAACLIIAGCNQKEDIVSGSVIGQWRLQKATEYYYEDNKLGAETTVYSSNNNTVFFEFRADGTYSMLLTVDGEAAIPETGTYTKIADKIVTVSGEGKSARTQTYTIESITNSTMVLVSEESVVENGITKKQIEKAIFEKIG
ncbi:MAG: lipocalin family protein [Bacteroidales bacterium]|nr:lipocalin family protein [Bacteroidales bacterium]